MDPARFDRLTVAFAGRFDRRRLIATGVLSGLLGQTLLTGTHRSALAMQEDCVLGCTESICGAVPPGCTIFPADNIWNTPIDTLPVAEHSDAFIASIGPDTGLHADFGAGLYEGQPLGIPFARVPETQASVNVSFAVPEESDPGPYPVPPDAPIEGGSCGTGDRHVIVIQEETCQLFEMYDATQQSDGNWQAFSGARFDLTSNALRPDSWTSADAAGLPILPGLIRYEEVEAGVIPYALRFTAARTQADYVWPARHAASDITDTAVPPLGQRFRLKSDVDIGAFSPTNQIILQALKTYGMFLADNGSDWFISGAPDDRWDNDDLHHLQELVLGSDFEAVDSSSLMVDPSSGQAVLNQ